MILKLSLAFLVSVCLLAAAPVLLPDSVSLDPSDPGSASG